MIASFGGWGVEGAQPGPIYQYENDLINEILHVKSTQYDNMMLVR
jgi:hypothetical protein